MEAKVRYLDVFCLIVVAIRTAADYGGSILCLCGEPRWRRPLPCDPTSGVALEWGVSLNAVLLANLRELRRLRREVRDSSIDCTFC